MAYESRLSITIDSRTAEQRAEDMQKSLELLERAGVRLTNTNSKVSSSSKNAGSAMGEAGKDARKGSSGVNQINRSLLETDSAAATAAATIRRTLIAALSGIQLASVVNNSREFNRSISELSAITGATGKDLMFLRDAAFEFGRTTTLSASQSAEAIKLIASAKPDLLENAFALKQVTKEAIILAEASGIDLPTAAKSLGNALNQFGESADQANRYINVLAAGAKFGSSEIDATAEALKNSGVSAAGAKVSFEETNAAIQALAKDGINAAEAGTALRNIILKLETSTNKQLNPSINGLSGSLQNLGRMGLDTTSMVKMFGLENVNAAQSLIKSTDLISDLTKKLSGTNTAYDQASTKINNLDGDLKALNSAFEAVQITLGDMADRDLRTLTQSLTSGLQYASENADGLSTALGAVGVVVASRLTGPLISNGIAFAGSTVQAVRYQAALASMAGVSKTTAAGLGALTLASRTASAAMGLLGGPVGLAITAASALVYFSSSAEDAANASRDLIPQVDSLVDSFKGLNRAQREVQIAKFNTDMAGLRRQIKDNNSEIDSLNELIKATFNESARFGLINEVEKLTKRNEELAVQLDTVSAKQQAVFASGMPQLIDASKNSADELGEGIVEIDNASKRLLQTLKDEYAEVTLGEKALSLYKAEKVKAEIASSKLSDANKVEASRLVDEILKRKEAKKALEQQRSALAQYQALQREVNVFEAQQQLPISGMGLGEKYRQQQEAELSIRQDFAARRLELEQRQQSESTRISKELYDRSVQDLMNAESMKISALREAALQKSAAEQSWITGASEALQNYADDSMNIYQMTADAFSNSLGTLETSLVDFALTGKASFSDMFSSIAKEAVSVLIKYAIGQVSMAALNAFTSANAAPVTGPYQAPAAAASAAATAGGFLSQITSTFAGLFDNGGRIGSDKWGIVGEYGPEIVSGANVTSRQTTADILKQAGSHGNGEVTVNVTVNAETGQTEVTGDQSAQYKKLGVMIGNAVRKIIIEEQRPMGLLDKNR
ncbi:phage tail tape measure protein [Shewanella algae]|uniref:phage tail tape measure protein n=1 Tax=Shewanella algae TaxID=38313 RepID=UPI0031F503AA